MINGATNFISTMETLVAGMTPIITIDTNTAEGSDWRLTMCRTYWLMVNAKITIGGQTFKVLEIDQDVSILVSGTAQPIGTTFQLEAPEFWHSSHRKVNTERKNQINITRPFVYLPVYEIVEDHNDETDISYTANIRPLFLASFDERKDTIDLQQSEVIEPMNAMATLFEELVESLDQQFNEPDSYTRKEWMNFGNETVWGNDELIFDQPLSGVELRLDLEVLDENLCLCDGEDFKVCADVTETFNGSSISSVVAGGTKAIVVQTNDATPVQTGTVLTDTSSQLIVEVNASGGSFIYDIFLNGVDTGQDLDMDGTNHTINLG